MGIVSRFKTLLKANVNHIAANAENPEKIIDQLIVQMREQLIDAKKQIAIVIADEKRLKKQYEQHQQQCLNWEKKASLAMDAQREDLAKEALKRKASAENLAQQYHAQWMQQKQTSETLKTSLRQLNNKIKEAEHKRVTLKAKAKHVTAQKNIHQTVGQLNAHSALDKLNALEHDIENMEAQVEARQTLQDDAKTLETRFAQLDQQTEMDDALSALKAKMNAQQTHQTFDFESQQSNDTNKKAS